MFESCPKVDNQSKQDCFYQNDWSQIGILLNKNNFVCVAFNMRYHDIGQFGSRHFGSFWFILSYERFIKINNVTVLYFVDSENSQLVAKDLELRTSNLA